MPTRNTCPRLHGELEAAVSPAVKLNWDENRSQPHRREGRGGVTQLREPGTAFHLLPTLFHLLQRIAPSEAVIFGDALLQPVRSLMGIDSYLVAMPAVCLSADMLLRRTEAGQNASLLFSSPSK